MVPSTSGRDNVVRTVNRIISGPGNGSLRVPNHYQRRSCSGACSRGCCYQIFKVPKLFHSQPIVIKLSTHIDDNIIHNRTVSDFQTKS